MEGCTLILSLPHALPRRDEKGAKGFGAAAELVDVKPENSPSLCDTSEHGRSACQYILSPEPRTCVRC